MAPKLQAAMALALPNWSLTVETVVDHVGTVAYRAQAKCHRFTVDHSMATIHVATQRHKTARGALRFLRGVLLAGAHLVGNEAARLGRVKP